MKKKLIWTISYGLLLLGFTMYILLDTFVISRGFITVKDEKPVNIDITVGGEGVKPNGTNAPNSENEPLKVSFNYKKYREYNTDIYVVDVYFSDVTAIRTAFAEDTYGQNVKDTTSKIAKEHNAFFAVNGDYYGIRHRGIVIRNGVLYRSVSDNNRECLVIYKDGSMDFVSEAHTTAQSLLDNGAWQVFTFGPGLLRNNEITVGEKDEVDLALASNPRTAIGYYDNNHYVFVVSDGRTKRSSGLSLYELAEFMQSIDVKLAYNLDGGGSSSMYFNGEIVNKPTADGKKFEERKITDIVYIGQ